MGIGVAIFLIAVGAILTFALETEVSGIDLDTVGIILMAVGALGLILTLFVFENAYFRTRGRVVDEAYTVDPVTGRRTIRRDEY